MGIQFPIDILDVYIIRFTIAAPWRVQNVGKRFLVPQKHCKNYKSRAKIVIIFHAMASERVSKHESIKSKQKKLKIIVK